MSLKVGIYAPWASGDMILATMVLKYKDLLWPDSQIVWYTIPKEYNLHAADKDIVANNPAIYEIRMAPEDFVSIIKLRIGNRANEYGHPLSVPKSLAGKMSVSSAAATKSFSDLDLLYFPAPWANCDGLTGDFVLTSKLVFDYPETSIHPCMYFSAEERTGAENFVGALPYKYSIMLETKCGSNQSAWNDETTAKVIQTSRSVLGECNFIFASPGTHLKFSGRGVVDCSSFTIRQCIPVYNLCHSFFSTASGVAVATCSWTSNPLVRRVEFTNNPLITTKPIAMGEAKWSSDERLFLDLIRVAVTGIKST